MPATARVSPPPLPTLLLPASPQAGRDRNQRSTSPFRSLMQVKDGQSCVGRDRTVRTLGHGCRDNRLSQGSEKEVFLQILLY